MKPSFNLEKYIKLLKPVASLSHLFSDNEVPYLNSKFVERLYVIASGARDTAADNSSFDAIVASNRGVGIKTFVSKKTSKSETEKIAEFTKYANLGLFNDLDDEELLRKAIELRNLRLKSDASAYGLDIGSAIYHCLIRVEGGAFIHEEVMSLIDVSKLHLVDATGKPIKKCSGKMLMSDGSNVYSYNKSKRVLYKKFSFLTPPPKEFGGIIDLPINRNILNEIGNTGFALSSDITNDFCLQDVAQESLSLDRDEEIKDGVSKEKPKNFVILPLYTSEDGQKIVQQRSGINQWNAGGRTRKFGEAYIPIPSWIHRYYPDFFPPRNQYFRLKLQDGTIQRAKICQDGGKALMTDPNDRLCAWFYSSIEPNLAYEKIKERLLDKRPYQYSDLVSVGKDSVKVTKAIPGCDFDFSLTFCSLGTFEDFKDIAGIED